MCADYLGTALKLARSQPLVFRQRLCSILTDGHYMFIGYNQRKSHPMQKRFATNPYRVCMHSEIDALRQAVRLVGNDLSEFRMYTARALVNGSGALAKPCKGCETAMKYYGVLSYEYTSDTRLASALTGRVV